MEFETLGMESGPQALAAQLRALVDAPESVAAEVAAIIERVRQGGDEALREFTERFDTAGAPSPPLRVGPEELASAERSIDDAIRSGLTAALGNVQRVAAQTAGAVESRTGVRRGETVITVREEPVRRAAVYVPGGRAPYPSTVIMGVG